MATAILLITAGIVYAGSALKGVGITEFLSGATRPLSPKGGRGGSTPAPPDPATTPGLSNNPPVTEGGQFRGPNAVWLNTMRRVAEERFHLRVTQICRPQNATYGAPNSLHKSCRAGDYDGSVANRVAFARYAKADAQRQGIDAEVFCDQAGMVAPGYEHTTHTHVGA